MVKKEKYINKLKDLISPTQIAHKEYLYDNYRKKYTILIRALTVFIFKNLSDKYHFLKK